MEVNVLEQTAPHAPLGYLCILLEKIVVFY